MQKLSLVITGPGEALGNVLTFILKNERVDVISMTKGDYLPSGESLNGGPPAPHLRVAGSTRPASAAKKASVWEKYHHDPRAAFIKNAGGHLIIDGPATLKNLGMTHDQLCATPWRLNTLEHAVRQSMSRTGLPHKQKPKG